MSLVPFLVSDLLDAPVSLLDQNFGLGMLADDLLSPRNYRSPAMMGYYRPWRHIRGPDSGVSSITTTDNEFKVNLDVQQFKPSELSVKTVDDYIVVEGKHEERRDEHGFISRQFQRRYRLPETVDATKVQSALSSDGVLTIAAPKKTPALPNKERAVPITQTNKPAIKDQQKPKQGTGEKMEQ